MNRFIQGEERKFWVYSYGVYGEPEKFNTIVDAMSARHALARATNKLPEFIKTISVINPKNSDECAAFVNGFLHVVRLVPVDDND